MYVFPPCYKKECDFLSAFLHIKRRGWTGGGDTGMSGSGWGLRGWETGEEGTGKWGGVGKFGGWGLKPKFVVFYRF